MCRAHPFDVYAEYASVAQSSMIEPRFLVLVPCISQLACPSCWSTGCLLVSICSGQDMQGVHQAQYFNTATAWTGCRATNEGLQRAALHSARQQQNAPCTSFAQLSLSEKWRINKLCWTAVNKGVYCGKMAEGFEPFERAHGGEGQCFWPRRQPSEPIVAGDSGCAAGDVSNFCM